MRTILRTLTILTRKKKDHHLSRRVQIRFMVVISLRSECTSANLKSDYRIFSNSLSTIPGGGVSNVIT